MPYVVPEFNLTVNVWNSPHHPFMAVDFQVLGNLAYSRRIHDSLSSSAQAIMSLLVPAGTDIRSGIQHAPPNDVVEVPAGSGRFYFVTEVDDVGKGFSNEHRCALIQQTTGFGFWPIPMP